MDIVITSKKIKGIRNRETYTERCYNMEFLKKLEGHMFANADVLCSYIGNDMSIMESNIPEDGLKIYALGKFMEIDLKNHKVKSTLIHYDENTMYRFINETRTKGFGNMIRNKEGFKELIKSMGKMDGTTEVLINRLHKEGFIKEVRAVGAPGL